MHAPIHTEPHSPPKSILRTPQSPTLPKSRKVRFSSTESKNDTKYDPSSITTSPPSQPAVSNIPQQPETSPSTYLAAAYPYGYYYHPYAYPMQYNANNNVYASMNGGAPPHSWHPAMAIQKQQQQTDTVDSSVSASTPPMMMHSTSSDQQKRMHLMAKSVSITVNQGDRDATQAAFTLSNNSNGGGTSVAGQQINEKLHHDSIDIDEHKEYLLLRHAMGCLQRTCMLRIFKAWIHLCEIRWWKTQIELRDEQNRFLSTQLRHLEWRPVKYIKRYRMKLILAAWTSYCYHKRAKKESMHRSEVHVSRMLIKRALQAWRIDVKETQKEMAAVHAAEKVHMRRSRRSVFAAWRRLVGRRAHKEQLQRDAAQLRSKRVLKDAFGGWAYLARYYSTEKQASFSHKQKLLGKAFILWYHRMMLKKQQGTTIQEAHIRHASSLKGWAFYSWTAVVDGKLSRRALDEALRLKKENEQLRQDNQRLSKVIDSGEWGRDRVSELAQAGQVLQQERDALLKLVESLPGTRYRRSSLVNSTNSAAISSGQSSNRRASSVSLQQQQQSSLSMSSVQAAVAQLKSLDHSSSSSSSPSRRSSLADLQANRRASQQITLQQHQQQVILQRQEQQIVENQKKVMPLQVDGKNAILRNKMAVKTASSFNALVRALKQDLLAIGALRRDPEAVYAIDQNSLQHVEMTADATIKIDTARNAVHIPGMSFPRARKGNGNNEEQEMPRDLRAGVLGGRSIAFAGRNSTVDSRNDGGGGGGGGDESAK